MNDLYRSSNFILLMGVSLLLFNGIWENFGINTFWVKGLFFSIISWITLASVITAKFKMPLEHVVILGTLVVFISFSMVLFSPLIVAVSYFQIFSPIVLFLITVQLLYALNVRNIENLFLIFVFFQVLASIVKFFSLGVSEGGGIGTLSVQAGSVSTFIVFFICLISARRIVMCQIWLSSFLLVMALFVAVVNEKRLGLLIVSAAPFLLLIAKGQSKPHSKNKLHLDISFAVSLILALLIANVLLVFGNYLVPSLTEGFSLMELLSRIYTYLFYVTDDGLAIGRIAGLLSVIDRMDTVGHWLIGLSPAELLFSNIVAESVEKPSYRAIGITILLARTGLLGIFLYLLFFRSLWRMSAESFTGRLFVSYLVVDFLVYSDTLFVSHGVIFLLILMLLKDKREN